MYVPVISKVKTSIQSPPTLSELFEICDLNWTLIVAVEEVQIKSTSWQMGPLRGNSTLSSASTDAPVITLSDKCIPSIANVIENTHTRVYCPQNAGTDERLTKRAFQRHSADISGRNLTRAPPRGGGHTDTKMQRHNNTIICTTRQQYNYTTAQHNVADRGRSGGGRREQMLTWTLPIGHTYDLTGV